MTPVATKTAPTPPTRGSAGERPPKPVCFAGDDPDAVEAECQKLIDQGGHLITWQFVPSVEKWRKLPINGWARNDRTSADPARVNIAAGVYPGWLPGASNIVALDLDSDVDACKEFLDGFDPEKPRWRPVRARSAGGRGYHYFYQMPAGGRFKKISQWGIHPPKPNGEVIRDWKRWGAIGSLEALRMINEAIELANEDALAKPPPGICVRATRGPTAPVVNPRRPAGDYSDFAVLGDGHCYVCGEGETRFIANHSFRGGEPGPWCWSCQPGEGKYREWLTDLRHKAAQAGKMPAASKQVPEGGSQDDALRVADIMLEKHGDDVRFDPGRPAGDDWLLFRDGIWRTRWGPTDARFPEGALAQKARNILEDLELDSGATHKIPKTMAWLKKKLARDYQWDKTEGVIPLPDGTVWTAEGPREGRREDFITRYLPHGPADTWKGTRWESFVEESVGPDAAGFLRRLCGYALLGNPVEHKFAVIQGDGGNGKTLFLETIRKAAGPLAEATSMEYFLASRNDAHPQYLARLDGARIIVAEEAPSNARWKGDLLKRFTGGGQIEARFMGRGSFTYAPRGTLFLALNQLPDIAVVDDAITRRLMIVRFPFKPETPDIHLAAKLEADLPVVVRWLLDGAEEYIERGLDVPDTIANSTEAYLESQDSPKRFLAECPKGEHLSCLRTALLTSYEGWCEDQGLTPLKVVPFYKLVRKMGFGEKRKKFVGIGLPGHGDTPPDTLPDGPGGGPRVNSGEEAKSNLSQPPGVRGVNRGRKSSRNSGDLGHGGSPVGDAPPEWYKSHVGQPVTPVSSCDGAEGKSAPSSTFKVEQQRKNTKLPTPRGGSSKEFPQDGATPKNRKRARFSSVATEEISIDDPRLKVGTPGYDKEVMEAFLDQEMEAGRL